MLSFWPPKAGDAPREETGRDLGRPGNPGRPSPSTTRILLGLLGLLAALAIGAMFLSNAGVDTPLEAKILSPEDGEALSPGEIIIRIRISTPGADTEFPEWELSYRRVESTEDWRLIQAENGVVLNLEPGNGLHIVEIAAPGQYEVRLNAQAESVETDDEFRASDRVTFTIAAE